MIFKKISCHRFSFFQGLYLASSAFKDYTESFTIVLGLGKTMSRQKSKLGQKRQFGKSAFTGFTPKALPILDFGMQHWNNAKIQPIKKSKLFKMLYCSFCHFSSILGHLSEVFWIIGVTFLFSLLLLQIW